MKLFPKDGIAIGLCIGGQRKFFERNGLDFRDYVLRGIEVEKVQPFADLNVQRMIEEAKKREEEDGRGR